MDTMLRARAGMRAGIGALLALGYSSGATAGGLEVPDNGTVALGRGGAFVARASDPTALIHNPAGLAGLPGLQIAVGSNFGSFSHCFARSGTYTSSRDANISTDGTVFASSHYAYGGTPYPVICNDPAISVVPHIAASYRVNRYVTLAVGAYGPNTTGANQTFPDRVMSTMGLAPSPGRELLYEKSLFLVHIAMGAAFAPVPWLRIGAMFEPSYASFNFGIMSNASADYAQSPDSDLHLGLDASGFFLAGNVGVQALVSRYLSVGANLHMNGTAVLQGTATATANYYSTSTSARTVSDFSIDRMTVPLPWTFRAGVRFALPRHGAVFQNDPHPERPYDPMVDDVFDLEAVFNTETTSMLSTVDMATSGSIRVGSLQVPAPAHVVLDSHLSDVYGFRLGGDVNVLPGRLALRTGVSFDSAAENSAYAQIHLPGYQTLGLHAGASVRVGFITGSVAYVHTFMAGIDASDGNRTVISTGGSITPANCANGAGDDACHVNRGVFTAHLDQVSATLAARF